MRPGCFFMSAGLMSSRPVNTVALWQLAMVLLAGVGFTSPVWAATAAMPLSARLVRAVEITINAPLDFGVLAFSPTQAGKVRIDAASSALVSEGSNGLYAVSGQPQAGQIVIQGTEVPVQLSLEQSSVRLSNGHDFITISDFNFINAASGNRITITPDENDRPVILPLGATLHTRVGQTSGHYVGVNRIYAHYE